MRETHQAYVSGSPLQFALRELRQGFSSPRQWAILLAVILLLIVSGPFNTLNSLTLPIRTAYWAATVILCFGLGSFVAALGRVQLIEAGLPQPWRFILIGIIGGVPAGLASFSINALTFGSRLLNLPEFYRISAYSVLIGLLVSGLFTIFFSANTEDRKTSIETSESPALLKRLDFDKRGDLISLSVADHYVEVTTKKGRQLLLMRLRDAIDECPPEAGLQIHRSHWVALSGIKSVDRKDGKVIVETVAEKHLPVSRSYLPDLRAKGLMT